MNKQSMNGRKQQLQAHISTGPSTVLPQQSPLIASPQQASPVSLSSESPPLQQLPVRTLQNARPRPSPSSEATPEHLPPASMAPPKMEAEKRKRQHTKTYDDAMNAGYKCVARPHQFDG
jgi:hypothetical protein